MYYNRRKEAVDIDIDHMKYLSSGSCGIVYCNNEMILKEYRSDTEKYYRLTTAVFDILKEMDHKHLMDIYDVYSLQSSSVFHPFIIDAYTAKYYQDDSVNIFYEPSDYVIDNFREIEQLLEKLARYHVLACDLKRKNTIIGKNGMVLIDPDLFCITATKDTYFALHHKRNLIRLFYNICKIDFPEDDLKGIIKEKIPLNPDSSESVSYQLSKTIGTVSRPIKYFRK